MLPTKTIIRRVVWGILWAVLAIPASLFLSLICFEGCPSESFEIILSILNWTVFLPAVIAGWIVALLAAPLEWLTYFFSGETSFWVEWGIAAVITGSLVGLATPYVYEKIVTPVYVKNKGLKILLTLLVLSVALFALIEGIPRYWAMQRRKEIEAAEKVCDEKLQRITSVPLSQQTTLIGRVAPGYDPGVTIFDLSVEVNGNPEIVQIRPHIQTTFPQGDEGLEGKRVRISGASVPQSCLFRADSVEVIE